MATGASTLALTARVRSSALAAPIRRTVALVGLASLTVASALMVVEGANVERSPIVPVTERTSAAWVHGLLRLGGTHLTTQRFGVLALVMVAAYGLVLVGADVVGARWALAAIVGLHVLFVLGPPFLSTDVFSYLSFGRLGALHGLNPYTHTAASAPSDPTFALVGWRTISTSYGPLFTLGSYALAPLSIAAGLWILKALAGVASLAVVALVWRVARALGRDPVAPVVLYGLSPVVLLFAVGGAHNDLLMLALAMTAVAALIAARPLRAGAMIVLAAAVKASTALLWPFMALGAPGNRRRFLLGTLVSLLVVGVGALIAFGPHQLSVVTSETQFVASRSVPYKLSQLLGHKGVSHQLHIALNALLGVGLTATLWLTWRGRDWLTMAGWATLVLLATTAWLLPWYVTWLLPLAGLGRSRALRLLTLALSVFVVAGRVPFLIQGP